MEATCEVTERDLAALVHHSMATDPAVNVALRRYTRQHLWVLAWAVPVALAPVGGVALLGRVRGPELWAALVIGIGAAAVVAYQTCAPHRCRARFLDHALESMRGGGASDQLGIQHIRLGPERLTFRNRWCNVAYSWTAVLRIASTADHDFFHLRGQCVMILPARSFANAAERERFVRAAREHHEAAATLAERIRLYLADQDTPCANCGYNLRGSAGQACPECGLAVDLAVVTTPDARSAAAP